MDPLLKKIIDKFDSHIELSEMELTIIKISNEHYFKTIHNEIELCLSMIENGINREYCTKFIDLLEKLLERMECISKKEN